MVLHHLVNCSTIFVCAKFRYLDHFLNPAHSSYYPGFPHSIAVCGEGVSYLPNYYLHLEVDFQREPCSDRACRASSADTGSHVTFNTDTGSHVTCSIGTDSHVTYSTGTDSHVTCSTDTDL